MATLSASLHLFLALQATPAEVRGTVRDAQTGEPLRAAVVSLTDFDRHAITDNAGRYVLRQVPAGPQHLQIDLVGYAARTLHALVPAAGALEINIGLRSQPIPLSPLSVRPVVQLRGVERSETDQHTDRTLSMGAIRNHPGLTEPDALQALAGGDVVVMPETPSGVIIRGGASDQTAYVLDGIPVFSPYHAAGVFSAWNPDALSQLQLSSSFPAPAAPHALSGVVAGTTRTPGVRLSGQGSFSTTQARVTVDGPLARAGYLLSARASYPALIAPHDEASYLRGENADVFAKVEARVLGGGMRVLGYASGNEIDAAAVADSEDDPALEQPRHEFAWHSRSFGAAWQRTLPQLTLGLTVWSATGDANARWRSDAVTPSRMISRRRDNGLLVEIEHRTAGADTRAGVRVVRSATSYRVAADSPAAARWSARAAAPVVTLFAQHSRRVNGNAQLDIAATLAAAHGKAHFAPRAHGRWAASEKLVLSASLARLFQFAQSARNAESIVGNIFPVDLYLVAGEAGVPVGRSDQAVVAAEYRPHAAVRLSLSGYEKKTSGLLLVPPREAGPFLTSGFTGGSGGSRGASLDFSATGSRYGVQGSYGWQRTRLAYSDSSYVPAFAVAQNIEAGVIVFPTTTSSIRANALAVLGRRGTTVTSGLEWEACNLLDRGCEFAGTPRASGELGSALLPAYLRVDIGVRRHWHVQLARRNATIAVFATVTNLFARRNVLNYAIDPATGALAVIGMRPLSPLVAGIDWRF